MRFRSLACLAIALFTAGCASERLSSKLNESTKDVRVTHLCVKSKPVLTATGIQISKSKAGKITDEDRARAFQNAQDIIKLYQSEQAAFLVQNLTAAGIHNVSQCGEAGLVGGAQLTVEIEEIISSLSPLGLWMSKLIVKASVQTVQDGKTLWYGRYYTGNKGAFGSSPDKENVEALASDIAQDVSRGPWFGGL